MPVKYQIMAIAKNFLKNGLFLICMQICSFNYIMGMCDGYQDNLIKFTWHQASPQQF